MKYILTESQYKSLIEKKRTKKITEMILEDLERVKKNLNEGTMLNEAIVDTLKRYGKKGLLTVAVLTSLLANNVSASDLTQAGVSPNDIQVAQQSDKKINPKVVERAIVNNLRRAGAKGTLQQFQGLDQQRKINVINSIANQLGGDLSKLRNMDLSLYLGRHSELKGDQFSKVGQQSTITVDTIYIDVVKDYGTEFAFNSAKLKDQAGTQKEFQEYLNAFKTVEKITIVASSSTLRNTGDMENTTWKQSSQSRVDVIKQLLVGMEYNLGGCGANETNTITENIIDQNINGTNGDGTSGPQSPFEVDDKMVASYSDRNINSEMWQSASEEAPLITTDEYKANPRSIDAYKQYQYVKVVITGEVVETKTNEIISLDYIKVMAKKDMSTINRNPDKGKQQGVKVQKCPVKF